MSRAELPSKWCVACGREMTWRKKWARNWDEVKYCSDACRRRGVNDIDAALEAATLRLLKARAADASICPSEAARAVDPVGWQALMEPARRAARRLVEQHKVQITQAGRAVDPSTAKGPIRIARGKQFGV
jgi:hypothetical protein